uniref:Mitochondrial ATPase complex subunit ATP10 n=1 Tax=Parastrongyloides trichosuri TaxID=131310 RepID=A0A0N4ZRU4_PARTI
MLQRNLNKNITSLKYLSRCYSSSINEHSNLKPNLDRKPEIFQLDHVQQRLSYTVPFMFRQKLDFTFYHKSVILDDKIWNTKKYGLQSAISYISNISIIGQLLFPHIHTEVVSIVPILDDGTIRLRWRICYITWSSLFLNLKYFNYEYRMKNLKWYDGLSIFTVDGDGLVYHVTLQKTNEETKILKEPIENIKSKIEKAFGTTNSVHYKTLNNKTDSRKI